MFLGWTLKHQKVAKSHKEDSKDIHLPTHGMVRAMAVMDWPWMDSAFKS